MKISNAGLVRALPALAKQPDGVCGACQHGKQVKKKKKCIKQYNS